MSLERKPERYDLDEITNIAKENILKFGGHIPTVIVKGSDGSSIAQFESLPKAHEAKARLMFTAGMDTARSNQVGQLWQVIFISEAWLSMVENDNTIDKPPSQDPNRKEILIITSMELVDEHQASLAIFEMVRDSKDTLIELAEIKEIETPHEAQNVKSPLLEAFVAGYRMGTAGMN